MEYIDFNKEELPESFDIDLADETFTLAFSYNETFDYFTVDLYKADEPLVLGEKLVLNQPLWADFTSFVLPAPTLIPQDVSGLENRITWDNLGETVFLFIDNEGDSDADA